MSLSKQDMMKKTVQFMKMLVDDTVSPQVAADAKTLVHSFRRELELFNEDVTHTETRPYMLLEAQGAEVLAEETVDRILNIAADNNMQSEFCKLTVNGQVTCLFSHKARPLIDEVAKHLAIGYGNILSNGIAIDGYQFLGFYSASEDRIKAGLAEAELYLKSCA